MRGLQESLKFLINEDAYTVQLINADVYTVLREAKTLEQGFKTIPCLAGVQNHPVLLPVSGLWTCFIDRRCSYDPKNLVETLELAFSGIKKRFDWLIESNRRADPYTP